MWPQACAIEDTMGRSSALTLLIDFLLRSQKGYVDQGRDDRRSRREYPHIALCRDYRARGIGIKKYHIGAGQARAEICATASRYIIIRAATAFRRRLRGSR
jgi:hypothetical protein